MPSGTYRDGVGPPSHAVQMNFLYRDDPTREHVDLGTFSMFSGTFTADECSRLRTLIAERKQLASTQNGDPGLTDVRRSELRWLNYADAPWAFDRLRGVALMANKAYGFDLVGLDSLQLTQYESAYRGHYDWHMDFGTGPNMRFRKLSVVVQLTDPDAYEGGELFVCTSSDTRSSMTMPVHKELGCAVVFPSYMVHRVSEVTSGTRHTLVGWVEGPPFR